MALNVALIKQLRDRTGAGMTDCKKALEETNNDIEAACDWLREKGIAKAAKKSSRIAAEGTTLVVANGNEAVILEVNSETDFVAKSDAFKVLVKEVADLLLANKPANVLENIIKGKVSKYFAESVLVEQDYLLEPGTKVGNYLKNHSLSVKKFIRYETGEGLAKRVENFAEEVQKQMQ